MKMMLLMMMMMMMMMIHQKDDDDDEVVVATKKTWWGGEHSRCPCVAADSLETLTNYNERNAGVIDCVVLNSFIHSLLL
jgi:hypothetical protein